MKKQFMALAFVFLAFIIIADVTRAATKFTDVSETNAAKDEIYYLVEQGIINGYDNGKFGINDEITRLQAAKMIVRALQLDSENRPEVHFTDITADNPDYAIIATVADEGILTGNANGQFNAYGKLTRAQMAAILVRAFDLEGESAYLFRDIATDNWAAPVIRTLFENNITVGYPDNTFKPNANLTRTHFALFLARVMNADFKQQQNACYLPTNEAQHVVNVAVTTLWRTPNASRVVDRPANAFPVEPTKWLNSMSYKQKLDLMGRIDTQALYGQQVKILATQGSWYKVAVVDQLDAKNSSGYAGWVPQAHITTYYPNYANCDVAMVTANKTHLYATMNGKSDGEISFNTMLPVLADNGEWLTVQTPTYATKYIKKSDVKVVKDLASITKPTQADLTATAKQFLGLPYLWAGVSAYGYDCSGFTHSIYKQHGILIPRDADIQAQYGKPVAKKDLQVGDLLFFAYNNGKGYIHHVSMYIGNGQMIHAPNYAKPLEITSIDYGSYKYEYAGARRYLEQ